MSSLISARRVCSLNAAELFVLCALRLVAPAVRTNRDLDRRCREGFECARLSLAHARHLANAIRIMDDAHGRLIDIREIRCAEASADEERLLQVLLLLQHENEFGARRVLWTALPPKAARSALGCLGELARGMVRAGLHLPTFPYALRPCPAETLAARQLGIAPTSTSGETFWIH